MGWVERQELAGRGQLALHRAEANAGLYRHRQVGRLVFEYPVQCMEPQRHVVALRRVAQAHLGPVPVWGHSSAMLGRHAHGSGNRVGRIGTEGQRRLPAVNGEGSQLRLGNVETS